MNENLFHEFLNTHFDLKTCQEKEKIHFLDTDGFYYITNGYFRVSHFNNPSKIITIAGRNEVIGNMKDKSPYQLTAISYGQLYFIRTKEFLDLCCSHPQAGVYFTNLLFRTMNLREGHLYVISQRTVKERVAGVLLLLHQGQSSKSGLSPQGGLIQVDKTTMANLSNTTIETFSRTITELESEGIIRRTGSYVSIINKSKLSNFSKF